MTQSSLHAFLQNICFGIAQDACTTQVIEQNLWRTENIDLKIFEDTQCIIQKVASKNTYMKVLKTNKITGKSDGFTVLHLDTPVNDFRFWVMDY